MRYKTNISRPPFNRAKETVAYLSLNKVACEIFEKGHRHYICNIFVYKYYISIYKVPGLSTAGSYVQR